MRALAVCLGLIASASHADPHSPSSLAEFSDGLKRLVSEVSPAVVQVYVTAYGGANLLTSSGALATHQRGGSGVIVDATGYIITNAHVVEGARRVQVLITRPDGADNDSLASRQFVGAQVVFADIETDIAVLKTQVTGLPILEITDSDDLQPGELVIALGSPLGLATTVSIGSVSAVARQMRPEDPMVYIQTDASINPGNSGGPLIDTEGQIVGINTFILSRSGGSEGLGFAVPSNIVRSVFEQVRETGVVRRGTIGVRVQTLDPIMAAGLGLQRDTGVIVSDLDADGPAAAAGLRVGDVVLALNGRKMADGRQFVTGIYSQAIGERVILEVLSNGAFERIAVRVARRIHDQHRFTDLIDHESSLIGELGLLCLEIDEHVATMIPPPRHPRAAVVVAARAPGSVSQWRDGFQTGDVLYEMNGRAIRSLTGLKLRVSQLQAGDPVVFQIERDGKLRYVSFQL